MKSDVRRIAINETDNFGRSPIFYSAFYGNMESVELLAAADADFNLYD